MTETDADGAAAGQGYGATLWVPDAETVRNARISHYLSWLAQRGIGAASPGNPEGAGPLDPADAAPAAYRRLWQWSVDHPGEFWTSVWDYFEVLGNRPQDGPALTGTTMPDVHWFPGATLNYARNALRTAAGDPDRTAVIYSSERGRDGSLSYRELADEVGRVAAGLRGLGVGKGDRVVALLPNIPEAVIGLLAAASIGAIWSSCSPDFGIRSVVDRWSQIEPAVLIAMDGYAYNGKQYPRADVVADIAAQLPSLRAVVMVDLLGPARGANPPALPQGVALLGWPDFGAALSVNGAEPEFEELPFEHPLWVVYSSGTTGLPKPIVHGHGGIVLEHLKSLAFQLNLGPGDRFSWYTTTGWMMWNFQVGGLLTGTTIVLYDGAATYPGTDRLWRLAADTGLSYLGVGAPYLMAGLKAGLVPREALRPDDPAGHRLHRLAAAARGLRLGVPAGQAGRSARLHVRRYRRVHRLRRARAAAADPHRDHLRSGARRQGRGLRRSRQAGHRRGRRAGDHRADAVDAGVLLERRRTAGAIRRAISPTIPASGGTATGSRCAPTARA